jgi:hypothetical protein
VGYHEGNPYIDLEVYTSEPINEEEHAGAIEELRKYPVVTNFILNEGDEEEIEN